MKWKDEQKKKKKNKNTTFMDFPDTVVLVDCCKIDVTMHENRKNFNSRR